MRRWQRGFTLLEVLVALTITSLVLGALLTLSAGSKRLALTAERSLHDSMALRAAVLAAQLDDGYRELEPALSQARFVLREGNLLPEPAQRTAASFWLPVQVSLQDDARDVTYEGSRWLRFDVPR